MPVRALANRRIGDLMMAGEFCKVKVNNGAKEPLSYSEVLDFRSVENPGTAEFLKELPSYNENNFSRFQPDTSYKNAMKKSTIYFPSRDHPCEQIITTERTTILLRYLQQQYERKKILLKRDTGSAGPSGASEPVPRKKSRLQSIEQ